MNDFLRIMREMDTRGAREIWNVLHPDRPPGNDYQVLITLHIARTQCPDVPDAERVYSHRWLLDHDMPSRLPDELKPKAEQTGPSWIVTAVGIAVDSKLPSVGAALKRAMSDAVAECYADGNEDPVYVKARMEEAKQRELRSLGLRAA